MSNEKAMIIHFIAGLMKKTFYKVSQHFSKRYKLFKGQINKKVDLSNCATKAGLKKASGVGGSNLAAKSNLASLKAKTDKIDIDKWKAVPVDLIKLNNVVNNEVVKKTVYNKLVSKEFNIDTSGFVLTTKYNGGKSDLEKKVSDADKKILILVDLLKKKQIVMLKLLK